MNQSIVGRWSFAVVKSNSQLVVGQVNGQFVVKSIKQSSFVVGQWVKSIK
jgi:hypothetical protein